MSTPAHTKKLYLAEADDWLRRQGTPMIIPARRRAGDALVRCIPWVLWVSIVYTALGSLEYTLVVMGDGSDLTVASIQQGAFAAIPEEDTFIGTAAVILFALVIPVVSLLLIWVSHLLMTRTPVWVQYIAGVLTVITSGFIFSLGFNDVLGHPTPMPGFWWRFPLMVLLVVGIMFIGGDTVVGWSLKHVLHQLTFLPPMIAKVLPVLMVSVLFIFVNADVWKLANNMSFVRAFEACGAMSLLALFVMLTTSYERTRRLLGARQGDHVQEFTADEYDRAAHKAGGMWPCIHTHTAGREETVRRPLSVGEWINMLAIPVLGQIIQTVFFMTLVFGFFMWFSSIAITDQAIEAWLGTTPQRLRLAGVEFTIHAVVLKVTLIVSVFSGLSFVATTSGDERYARDFVKPMILRLRHILVVRDMYLALLSLDARQLPEYGENNSAEATDNTDTTESAADSDNTLSTLQEDTESDGVTSTGTSAGEG